MCGILGSINYSFDSDCLDTMSHRGPDDSGLETFLVKGNTVQLAHRRLSIIDLSAAGHQPMSSFCKNYAIIFNGEIYNHLELRKRLPNDIPYKSHSDTETLLYHLKQNGINGIKEVNGIFAFAFLDKRLSKMFLTRDPFGVKPLYYHIDNNKLIFASEIRPIRTLVETTLDKEALASLLRLRYNAAPKTLHKEIKKLRPGHYLEIDLGEDIDCCNKAFLRTLPETVNINTKDSLSRYGQILEAAVTRQLLSDVEIGILLSGGVDSAIIASLAQKNYKGNLKAFTIGFEGNHSEDEIEKAAETAHCLNLDHHHKKISFNDFLSTTRECVRIVEEPLATTSLIPMYFLSELASKHVKVVLTGQGADESLGGYKKYKLELIRHLLPKLIRNSILPIARLFQLTNERVHRGTKALGIENEMQRFLAVYEIFTTQEIEKLINAKDTLSLKTLNYFYHELRCGVKDRPVERMMALDARMNLADDLLNYTDKISMHFSLECRVPMLDVELVHFIESLPQELKIDFSGGKLIHKKFAEQILPKSVINRKKLGFQSPTNNWFRSESDAIGRILLKKGTYFSEVFNQPMIEQILRDHNAGQNREKQIFLLLSLFFWLENLTIEKSTVVVEE